MGRKLITTDEAKATKAQHTKPCSDCPFLRTSLCGWLGGHAASDFIAVARGDSDAGCHAIVDEQGEARVCAGVAIFRANTGKSPRDRSALRLPADRETVFSTSMEFMEHHAKPVGTKSQ